jgi:hypothetical protein
VAFSNPKIPVFFSHSTTPSQNFKTKNFEDAGVELMATQMTRIKRMPADF